MNVMALMATLGLDTSEYESGLNNASGMAQKFASKLGTVLKGVAIGKTLFDVGKGAVNAYKDYEQLVGGIDTLFKSSSAKVQAYANEAYKTAGMSANEYMSTAISFSASLINSLHGDTDKAAEQTNKALMDMSDNANKMGTNFEAVQNAYRGFARGNFTMLDNLSLGYSGTKEGMEDLLKRAEELSGVKYDISSYSDIIDAIHEVQQAMDITGTTAKEAMETIEGSMKAVKASWENVLTAIAGGGDLGKAINGLVTSIFGNGSGGLLNNIVPRITETIKGIASFVAKSAPIFIKELPKLVAGIGKGLVTMVPTLLKDLVTAIPSTIGGLFEGIDDALGDLFGYAVDRASDSYQNIKSLIEKGLKGTVTFDGDDGSEVFAKANTIIATLQTDDYKGTLTIDGDSKAAGDVLTNLQTAITNFKNGGSIQELQKAIEDCEKLTINPELPEDQRAEVEAQLKALMETLEGIAKLPVALSATEGTVLSDTKEIIKKLEGDEYKGKIVIDGDHGAARKALSELESAINSLANGDPVRNLQEKIAACEKLTVSPELSPSAKDEVQRQLDLLMGQLKTLSKLPVVVTATAEDAKGKVDEVIKYAEDHPGTFVINGNANEARSALTELGNAVAALTGEGGSVAKLQKAIADCEKIKISPEYADDTNAQAQIDALKVTLDGMKTLTITFTGEGQQAIEKAGETVDKINKYKGIITINGNANGADAALESIKQAISNLQSGEGSVGELQAAIEACKSLTIDPSIDKEKKEEVETALQELKTALQNASGHATITYSATGHTDAGWNEFKAFVDSHGWTTKDFTAVGKFTVEGSTADDIRAYAAAISAAATAVGDYEAAASKITSLAEKKLEADIQSVNEQAAAEVETLAILYNQGLLSEEEYHEYGGNVYKQAEEQTAELQQKYDALTKETEKFTNHTHSDDYNTALDLTADAVKDFTISEETSKEAVANLKDMVETGRDVTDNDRISAKTALDYLESKSAGTKEMAELAFDDYANAMAKVEKMQTEAEQNQQMADTAGILTDIATLMEGYGGEDEKYNAQVTDVETMIGNIQSLITDYASGMYTGRETELSEGEIGELTNLLSGVLYDEKGNARDIDQSEISTVVADLLAELQAQATEQKEAAEEAKQQAEAAIQEALKAATENNEMSTEEIDQLIAAIEKAGIEVDEATKNTISTVESVVETAADQVASGSEGAIEASLNKIKELNELAEGLEATISEKGAKGAAEAGAAGKAQAAEVSDAFDTAIEKERTMPVKINIKGGGRLSALLGSDFELNSRAMSGGRILRGLTPFGIDSNGVVQYGGDAGAEAVVGVNSLDKMIQESVASAIGTVLGRLDQIIGGQNQGDVKIVMDNGALVGQMVRGMDRQLGAVSKWRGGGRS